MQQLASGLLKPREPVGRESDRESDTEQQHNIGDGYFEIELSEPSTGSGKSRGIAGGEHRRNRSPPQNLMTSEHAATSAVPIFGVRNLKAERVSVGPI